MPIRLATTDANFDAAFASFLASKREVSPDVEQSVRAIIADVRQRGDAAVVEYTRRFDEFDVSSLGVRMPEAEIREAARGCDAATLAALAMAKARIEAYHERQLPKDEAFTDGVGAELGWRWSAIESVGLYVPGGLASYPSSLLMNAVPAKVAGVPRIAVAVPAPKGEVNPYVLAAADIVGISEIYRIGGAQAVAAFAFRAFQNAIFGLPELCLFMTSQFRANRLAALEQFAVQAIGSISMVSNAVVQDFANLFIAQKRIQVIPIRRLVFVRHVGDGFIKSRQAAAFWRNDLCIQMIVP